MAINIPAGSRSQDVVGEEAVNKIKPKVSKFHTQVPNLSSIYPNGNAIRNWIELLSAKTKLKLVFCALHIFCLSVIEVFTVF